MVFGFLREGCEASAGMGHCRVGGGKWREPLLLQPLQFPILWLPPCAWEGGLAPARDARPLQVLEANPPGILRLVTRHK